MMTAEEKAHELLPCYHERRCDTPGMKIIALCESCKRRPAIADALQKAHGARDALAAALKAIIRSGLSAPLQDAAKAALDAHVPGWKEW